MAILDTVKKTLREHIPESIQTGAAKVNAAIDKMDARSKESKAGDKEKKTEKAGTKKGSGGGGGNPPNDLARKVINTNTDKRIKQPKSAARKTKVAKSPTKAWTFEPSNMDPLASTSLKTKSVPATHKSQHDKAHKTTKKKKDMYIMGIKVTK